MTAALRKQALLSAVRQHGSRLTSGESTLVAYRQGLCDTFLAELNCSRASLWRLVGEPDARRLRCVGISIAGQGFMQPDVELDTASHATYVSHLISHGTFAASDVMAEPMLKELHAYFEATGVRSLMDSVFQLNGEVFGVVCLEQTDTPRTWTQPEQSAFREAMVLISLAIARMGPRFDFDRYDTRRADDDGGSPWY